VWHALASLVLEDVSHRTPGRQCGQSTVPAVDAVPKGAIGAKGGRRRLDQRAAARPRLRYRKTLNKAGD
jgi:hypothetical protein